MTTTLDLTAADVREGDVLVSYLHLINGIHSSTYNVDQWVISVTRETHSVLTQVGATFSRSDQEFAVLKTEGRSIFRLPLDRAVVVTR